MEAVRLHSVQLVIDTTDNHPSNIIIIIIQPSHETIIVIIIVIIIIVIIQPSHEKLKIKIYKWAMAVKADLPVEFVIDITDKTG